MTFLLCQILTLGAIVVLLPDRKISRVEPLRSYILW